MASFSNMTIATCLLAFLNCHTTQAKRTQAKRPTDLEGSQGGQGGKSSLHAPVNAAFLSRRTDSCGLKWHIGKEHRIGSIHIGKCAGTSMDSWWGQHWQGDIDGTGIHADMSYFKRKVKSPSSMLMTTWLREPAHRAASNILFWNTLGFTSTWKGRSWPLTKILADSEQVHAYRGAGTNDGWGGTCWLAGTCVNGWYVHTDPDGKNDEEQKRREDLMKYQPQKVLETAKRNLESTAWFGLIEREEESMELLQWQLGIKNAKDTKGIPVMNKNAKKHRGSVTDDDLNKLRSMMPMDVALYAHAQKLFDERWSTYQKAKASNVVASAAGCMVSKIHSTEVPSPIIAGPASLINLRSNLTVNKTEDALWHLDLANMPNVPELSDFVSLDDV